MHQTIKLILCFSLLSSHIFGQSIERTATYSGGEFMSNNGSVSWTIGEPITETWSTGSNQLTQGFQQGITTTLPLPVELLDFQAERLDFRFVLLSWETASEQNNKGFFIERKIGKPSNFEVVGFIEGHGNSTELVYYEHIDNNTFSGESYYQLRQIDFDEKESLSEIRVVKGIAIMPNVSVFPNPTTHNCTLTITSEHFETSKGNLSLY